MEFRTIEKKYDFIVIGGGFSGVVSAVEASRNGLKTALISNRGFIGGNSGAEIRCPVDGADGEQQFNFNSRETGLIEEIRLENLHCNREGNSYRWDAVLMDFIMREPLLDLYLNTVIDRVDTKERKIVSVSGVQFTSEKRFLFSAPLFEDNTGDGTIAYLSGCSYSAGAGSDIGEDERISEKDEKGAMLLSTLTYYAKNLGHKVGYIPPDNSFDIEKTDILKYREIPKEMFQRFVWFYEVGGNLDQIADSEKINMEHRRLLYSIWDYIKKHDYGADDYDFEYISPYPGKRESRRIDGLYKLNEHDVTDQHEFEDAVGYGGWAIDLHSKLGFYGQDPENWWVYLKGIYQIPLRTAIAKDIDNLFVVGRCFSVTHVALGSTRLNATLATVGQAVGIAAAMCIRRGVKPTDVASLMMDEMHRLQYRADQYVIGYRNEDPEDKALGASVFASSELSFHLCDASEWFGLDTVIALSLPLRKGSEKIAFRYSCTADTSIKFRLYKPDKKQNYGPDMLLLEKIVDIPATEDSNVEFIFDKIIYEDGFYFIEIEGNTGISLAVSTDRLPCVTSLMRKQNTLPNVRNYPALEMMEYEWMRLGMPLKLRKYSTASMKNIVYTPCFNVYPEQSVYPASDIINGYSRPYGWPNIWAGDGCENEYIEFDFGRRITVSEIDIVFNSDLNFRIRNVKPYDFGEMPEIVADYDIIYMDAGEWKLLREIRGNYQRLNKITSDNTEMDKLRIRFIRTNGCKYASLYSVSVY